MKNKFFTLVFMGLLSACGDKDGDTAAEEETQDTGQEEQEDSEASEGEDSAAE